MAEELIGGFGSPNIARGTLRGYGLYATTDRIIGVKGGLKQFAGVLGEMITAAGAGIAGAGMGAAAAGAAIATGVAVGKLSVDDAKKAIEQLEQKKDFEVRKEELKEIRIQPKKGWLKRTFVWWGDLTIKTANDTYAIRLIKGDTEEVQMSKNMFTAFDKDKFIAEDK
ncbi:hypothetical protein ACFLVF_03590 [Chloroflexota bacterium]